MTIAIRNSNQSVRNSSVSVSFICLNTMPFLPLSFGLLKAACEEHPRLKENLQWKNPIFLPGNIETYASDVATSDLALASCYIWNTETSLAILRRAKELNPRLRVIVGGPNVPDLCHEFLLKNSFIDFAVHGEGETVLPELLDFILLNPSALPETLHANLSFLKGSTLHSGPRTKMVSELRWKSPYLEGWLDSSLKTLQEKKLPPIALWETNRGCPYTCSFCDWGSDTMTKIRPFAVHRLKEELEFFGQARIEELYICDANFGIFPQDEEIAQWIVNTKLKYGYPKGVRLNFAKQSNDRVFRISRLFDEHQMHWGTTLSLQSLNEKTLSDIQRKNSSKEKMSELLLQYRESGIATYTELILGLPEETKETFTRGLDELFRRGQHDDVRVFELSLLPNAQMNQAAERNRSVKKTAHVPLFNERQGDYLGERAEVVTETPWMSFEDWVDCLVFSDVVQACHNGGYTRWLSIFLERQCGISFRDFYSKLINTEGTKISLSWHELLTTLYSLQKRFGQGEGVPQVHKAMSEPYFREVAQRHHPDRRGWFIYQVVWLKIQDFFDEFYLYLKDFLPPDRRDLQEAWSDLIQFQKKIMLRPDYDPALGHTIQTNYNWTEYFNKSAELESRPQILVLKDTHMGSNRRYTIKKNDLKAFSSAAVGQAYPYSKKFHFMHRFDQL